VGDDLGKVGGGGNEEEGKQKLKMLRRRTKHRDITRGEIHQNHVKIKEEIDNFSVITTIRISEFSCFHER
jgi:hypothetical protein